jgi:gamma-glutamyltranspeptidase/glutathione hydrolase
VTSVHVISNLVDFGLNVQDAVSAPRFRWVDEMTDPLPAETLLVESRVPAATRARLRELGCKVVALGPWSMRVGGAQAIVRDTRTGWFMGGADPRRNGYAIGWP